MKRNLLLTLLLIIFSFIAQSQVNITGGTSAAGSYPTVAAAITALNGGGALSAPVIVNVDANHTETLTARITLTISGTLANAITIQRTGVGANPRLTSYVGTAATPAAATPDGMFALAGTDYVTIDGIDLQESALNTTATTVMEYGYGLFKTSGTNGAQNNTIKNCSITLNRVQGVAWTSTVGYVGSTAIGVFNSTATTATTSITTTTTDGSNSLNKFYGNTIQNCNTGVSITGFAASTPFTLGDTNNDIGGTAYATGNTILNFGGGATTASAGISTINQWSLNASYNTINNNNGSGVNHTGILKGIFTNTATSASLTCNYNNITIKGGGTTVNVTGIENAAGGTPLNNNTVVISNNKITGDYLTATSGTFNGIFNSSAPAFLYVTNDTIQNYTHSTNALAGSGAVYGILLSGSNAATVHYIRENLINNIQRFGTTGGTIIGIYNNASLNGLTQNVSKNIVSNLSIDGTGTSSTMYGIQTTTGTIRCDSNTVFNLSCLKTTGTGALYGIYNGSSPTNETFNNNEVYNIAHSGTGTTYCIYAVTTAGIRQMLNNTIYNVSGAGTAVAGLVSASSSPTIAANKIYAVSSTSAGAPTVSGIILSTLGTTGTANIHNNLIADINAPNASYTSEVALVRGINITGATANSTINLSFNTVYLTAASTGANFSSAALFVNTSTTATTGNLTMKSNIFINKSSIGSSAGFTVAYRRGSGIASTLANFNTASDKNLFYAGTPGVNNLIYYDGTSSAEDLDSYKTGAFTAGTIAPADANSYTEDVVFQSTTGSSANFLKYNTVTPSVIESAGLNVSGITTDFGGTIRQGNLGYAGTGSAPDLGAWELDGTAVGGCAGTPDASNANFVVAPTCNNQNFTVQLSFAYGIGIAYQWQSSTTSAVAGFTDILSATNSTLATSTNKVTWYRCVVTCIASGLSINSGAVQTTVVPLAGTFIIDNTGAGDYISFADAVTDISCKGALDHVVFNVTAGQVFVETASLNLTSSGADTATITFQKTGVGANPKIQLLGTVATTEAIIKLTGVSYYTFNGIDLEQTGTDASTWVEYGVHITNSSITKGSHYNTFKNGTISLDAGNAASKGVYLQASPSPTAISGTNSNNKFLNMNINGSFEGYRITGASTAFLDDNNEINTESGGNSIIQNLGNATVTGSMYGVIATHQTNLKVKNTEIVNLAAGGTSLVYGITMQTTVLNTGEIENNKIHNISGGGTVSGIHITLAKPTIVNNEVYDLSTSTNTSNIRGIFLSGTGIESTISGNKVYNISSSGTSTTTAAGIDVAVGLVYNIYNNMVSSITAPASTTTTGGTRGISVSGGSSSGLVKIYYNTVLLSDVGTVAGYTSAALHNASTTPILDIRNNIFINNSDVTTGTRAAAFWKTASTDNIDDNSNNNLYYAGTPGAKNLIYYNGTAGAETINNYKAVTEITNAEAVSVTENVAFATITNGIIRPVAATPTLVESSGQIIGGLTVDFENNARAGYPLGGQVNGGGVKPDLGADEGDFTYIAPLAPDCVTLNGPADVAVEICNYSTVSLTWGAANTGGLVTLGYDVYFGTTNTPPLVTNVSGFKYDTTGLLPNTTYYWKVVAKNEVGDAVGCTVRSFSTLDAVITGTTPGSRVGTGSVNLSATGTGTLRWYNAATGGTVLGTGNNFATPSISCTQTYYVGAGAATGESGNYSKLAPEPASTGTNLNAYTQVFTITKSITFNSIQVFSSNGTAITINLHNSDGTTLLFTTGSNAVVAGTSPTINLNWTIEPGTYRLGASGMTLNFIRDNTNTSYPINLGTFGQVNGFTSTVTGSVTTTSSYYFMYNWNISTLCESPRTAVTATVEPGNWLGVNTDWSNPANWCGNVVPTSTSDVVISASANNPALTATSTCRNITIASGASVNLNGQTLNVTGNITNNGGITTTTGSTLGLTGSTLQTVALAGDIATNNLNLDNVAGAELTGVGKLNVSGVYTPTSGALATGGNLVLKSTASGTARIAAGTGSYISGNVTTETFIPGGRRAFRFLGHPFTAAQAMSSLVDDIFVTGSGAGFDATLTNAASSFWYDNVANAWTTFTSTSDASWAQHRGTRVLVRGDRSQADALTGAAYTPNAVTLDMTGAVNTGNQNISVPTAGNFHLVSNPYPSPTDIGTVIGATTDIGTTYWVWNANAVTRGAYVPLTVGDGAYNLAMNGAFFVQPTATTTLAFTESNKVATATANLFRTQATQNQLELQVNYNGTYADKLFVRNSTTATAGKELTEDGNKLMNPEVNMYTLATGNEALTLDARPIASTTVIPMGFTSSLQSNFEIVLNSNTLNNPVVLKDKFLNVEHVLTPTSPYNFTVTNDAASQGTNRFELVFRTASALPTTFVSVAAQQKGAAIEVTFNTANEANMHSYEVEESKDGSSFTKGTTLEAKNATANSYSWLDVNVHNGNNYYRVKAIEKNGVVKYSQVVRVNIGTKRSEFTVYPNPVKGGTINLQLTDIEKGVYTVKVVNNLGQEIAAKQITHNGGSANQTISIGNVPTGKYNMVITNGTTTVTKTVIVE